MKKVFNATITTLIIVTMVSCGDNNNTDSSTLRGLVPTETASAEGTQVNIYDFNGLKSLFDQDDDTLYIINFWATWCKPCIKELPYFERINKEYGGKEVKVILVSLDFRPQVEGQLIPFMVKNNLRSEVLVLHDPDANAWIEQVDPGWSGAIPATLFIREGERSFYEQSLSYEELKSIVESKL
jgi:thiol-disulfide isomerase/thioredoxin